MRVKTSQNNERLFKHYNSRLYILVAVILLAITLLINPDWRSEADFHTLMELAATLLALIIGIISLIRYFTENDDVFLFIGVGFLGTAFLDGYHAIVTNISFIDLYPSIPSVLIPWSWNASRTFLSILMFLSYWVWARPQSESIRTLLNHKRLIVFLSLLLISIFLFFIYAPLPSAYYPDSFFGRPADLIPAVIFLLALWGFYIKADWREESFEYWLVLSLLINVVCQFFYMPFSQQIFDGMFVAAHLLKVISYACVMIGLLISFYQLHRRYEWANINLQDEVEHRQQAEQALNENISLLKKQRVSALNVAEDAERAYTNLKSVEANIRSIVESAPYAIIAVDEQSIIREWNAQAERIFGWLQAEVTGKTLTETIIPGQYHKAHSDGMVRYLETGQAKILNQNLELMALHKNGKEFPIQLVLTQADTSTGASFISFIRDMTKEKEDEVSIKRAEKTIIENKQQLKGAIDELDLSKKHITKNEIFLDAVLSNMEEGVVACDADGILSYFNQATIDFHGKDVSQLPAEEWSEYFDLYHADGKTLLQADEVPLYRAYEGENVNGFEMIIAPKNGKRRLVICYGQQIHDAAGQRLGAVVTMHDITKSKAIELELRESEERFKGAFASAAHGIAVVALDGHWLKVNNSLCEILGYSEEELLKTDFQSITYTDDLDIDLEKVQQLINGEIDAYHLEKRYIHKQGHSIWALLSVSLVRDSNKKPQYFVSQLQDLTAKKAVEAERAIQQQLLIDKEAADAANLAKSTFLANMSHELRTPLNAIIGYSEMLVEDADDSVQAQTISDLNKIRGSGKHLLTLINGILDLSKIEAGKMELTLEHFAIDDLLYEVSTTMQPLFDKNGNTFKTDCPEHVPEMYSDSQKIKQILFNLLSNAAKFTSAGMITLTIQFNKKNEGQTILSFIISDTGIGMDEEQLSQVFSAFSQADNTTTRKYGGTGLGLAISKRFSQMLGGEIFVSSELGKGSVFTVSLPTEITDVSISKKEEPKDIEFTDSRILEDFSRLKENDGQTLLENQRITELDANYDHLVLIIDDDVGARELMSYHLSQLHFNVVTAKNGMQGIKHARELQPEVIVLDLLMPHMDGWAVLQILKADPVTADIPVIMCSMNSDEKETGYALGATDYLVKPVNRDHLLKTLEQYYINSSSHLLVVEDDKPTRELIVRTAEKKDWKVVSAENGVEALAKLESQIPGLILLDLMMPEMDGFQFVEQLQQHSEWRDIPIIIMTAKDLTDADRTRLRGYVEVVLEKGQYSIDVLMEQITKRIKTVAQYELS